MKSKLITTLAAFAAFSTSALALRAAPLSFDFKDPKGVNNVQFHLDAPLESIAGTGTGISGTVSFDPANPASVSGTILLDAATLAVGNPMMTDHLRGGNWLDVKQFPTIEFSATSASNVQTKGNQTTADLHGKLTLKGVTKDIKVPVTFSYLADKMGARVNKPELKGDLLVIRSTFSINRSEFGIQPGQNTDKVSEEISLTLSLAGAAPKN